MTKIVELAPSAAAEAMRRLMPREGYAWRRCFGVLDGASRGRVLADDLDAPTWAAVQELSDDNVMYLGGSLRREQVAEAMAVLRRDRSVSVGWRDELAGLLPAGAAADRVDIDFEDRDLSIDLAPLAAPPPGLRLARIDAGLLDRCLWFPWMVREDTPLDLGLGYCLLDGKRVVAEAFAGPAVGGVLEMAVITDEAYRRRGLARIVSARTILECERRGEATWWNTSLANAGSAALARMLGYRSERRYRVIAWGRAGQA